MTRIRFETGLSLLLLATLLAVSFATDSIGVVLIIVAIIGALPVVYGAITSAFMRDWASMDMLASVALLFSLVNSEWTSSVFIALMLSSARLLSLLTESRTERSIESMLKLRPEKAHVERNGKIIEMPVSSIVLRDIVIVDIGERLPIDGVIESGDATLDESSLTGESLPVEKSKGMKVFSSTLVVSGSLRVITEKIGKDTTLEKIIELVKSSREQRSKIYTLAEKFGKAYLICIFLASALLLFITHNPTFVLAVVLVVCADDVAIAIPIAYLSAIGSAAKRGVIVKGSAHLEAIGRATTFVFDKTGTLTTGKLSVAGIYCAGSCSEDDVIRYSAIASGGSEHPLSRAIIAYADQHGVPNISPDASHSIGGKGIVATYNGEHIIIGRAQFLESEGVVLSDAVRSEINRLGDLGMSISIVARNGTVLGIIGLHDEPKKDIKKTLTELRTLGATRLIMLTGDNERVAKVVAEAVGITEYFGGLLPEDKVRHIKELMQTSEVVMVGDGVNDAAALSSSTVGVAMGAIGYDTAIESAEIVLMHDNISEIPNVIRLARHVRTISIQDFWIWGITNAFGLLLVFTGYIGPSGAAAYNFISDFFPLANSLRARKINF